MNSKGAMRTLAKLFLNNLYGKLASSTKSSFKKAYVNKFLENNPSEFVILQIKREGKDTNKNDFKNN